MKMVWYVATGAVLCLALVGCENRGSDGENTGATDGKQVTPSSSRPVDTTMQMQLTLIDHRFWNHAGQKRISVLLTVVATVRLDKPVLHPDEETALRKSLLGEGELIDRIAKLVGMLDGRQLLEQPSEVQGRILAMLQEWLSENAVSHVVIKRFIVNEV